MEALDPKKPKPQKSDHEKYVYFQPGQMIFVVTHTNAGLIEDDLNALIAWSDEKARARGLRVFARPTEESLSFPAFPSKSEYPPIYSLPESEQPSSKAPRIEDLKPHGPFSIVLADVKDINDSAKYIESTALADFITQLDDLIYDWEKSIDRPQLSDGTVLEVVSPNWLSSPSSETGTGGGPGGRPVPFPSRTPPGKTQHEFRFVSEELEKKMTELLPPIEKRGENVIVAILDTAPCMHDLVAAYERWQKVDPQPNEQANYPGNPSPPHGLIETLLEPGGPLTVHYASYEELLRMRSVHLKDHDYNMTDHGLFVAGIIHSIAPAAKIHLYEVLNPEGVGDLKSLADGLSKVWKSFSGQPLVVNCSLVMNIPLFMHPITDLAKGLKAKFIHEWDKHEENHEALGRLNEELWNEEKSLAWLARQARDIERICDLIYEWNSRVIAAAGNDWGPGQPRPTQPQARYPAAFTSAVGVGALKKRLHRSDQLDHAKYSDRSDRPEQTGITTLGGEQGRQKGVLGVYLGNFPPIERHDDDDDADYDPAPTNRCDWAFWAGTSFAAPIISGLTAAVLSKMLTNNPGSTTQEAIQALYDAQAITIGPFGEDVLDVTQGPLPS